MNNNYTLYFDEISKKDLPLVGGKGANLGEMTKAGFPVPYGFCVTTEAYKKFIEYNDLAKFIAENVKDARLENITELGLKIRNKLSSSEIPAELEAKIINSVHKIGIDNYYAVRSSATAEDLAFASFAGQQDTYLNIKGEQALLNSIKDCWASLFTDRAILYRIKNKIEHEKVHMSVVVQKMILPEVSGIMFTADPVSGHRGIISIDASYGLGEALVSGLVSPDIYKFKKSSFQVESKNIAEKKLAIMPIQGGGTKKVEITGEKSVNQVMKDSEIIKLAELGMKIEKHYGCPQDIEWCMDRKELFIVQSRPITSLFPLPSPIPNDSGMHVYLSLNHLQVMTDPISPLGLDVFRNMLTPDKASRIKSEYKFAPSSAGRIYGDVSEVLKFKKGRQILVSALKNMDAMLGEALAELVNREDFTGKLDKNKISKRKVIKFITPILIKVGMNLIIKNTDDTAKAMNVFIEQYEEKVSKAIKGKKHGIEKLDAINEYSVIINDFIKIVIPNLAPGLISLKFLESMEKKLLGTTDYVNTISKGLEGNVTTEMGLLIGDLADMIRKSPELIKEFQSEDYRSIVLRINNLNGNEEFKKVFNAFMNRYGVRAAGEIDIARDRWMENPEPLVKSILAIVSTSKEGIHRKEYSDTIEEAKIAAEKMIKEVEVKQGKLKAGIVKRLIKVLRNTLPMREHHKFLMMRLSMIFKNALLEEARILVKNGQLIEEKDIFFVGMQELYKAIKNNESLLELVKERKEEYEHFSKLKTPRVMTSEGEEIKAIIKRENLPEGALAGIPVSSGVVEGIATVITDPSKSTVNKGEILIAPFTDPGWTPLFINAAGLVMEVGGQLTHGTVVAREYGIPAVVGISDATKVIKTGQRIRVDGNAGYVMVIEE